MGGEEVVFEGGIEGFDEFIHDGDDGYLEWFSVGNEVVIEVVEDGVMARGTKGGHVKDAADMPPSALTEASAHPLAALAGDGGDAGQGSGLIALEASEFGHEGQQRVGQDRARAFDGGNEPGLGAELRVGVDELFDFLIQLLNLGFEKAR